jgi:EpsI family protein
MRSARFWVVVLLMSLTVLLLQLRGDVDRVPPSRPLSEFPVMIGARTATDIAINAETMQLLGKGEFLNRVYLAQPLPQLNPEGSLAAAPTAEAGARAPIGLFIGYFPTQRTGQSIHSPQNCLPGAGWTFLSSWTTSLTNAAGHRYQVQEFLITDGSTNQEVLYWYQMHGRVIASDYAAKLYTLAGSIRYGRSDAALVRIITPVEPGEERLHARTRAVDFAEQIAPLLPAYVPD